MTTFSRCVWLVPFVFVATSVASACGSSGDSGIGPGAGSLADGGGNTPTRCSSSGQCAPPTPYCDTAGTICVECLGDANCANTRQPVCNPTTHSCAQCAKDGDCGGGQPYCDTTAGRCVACVTGANCGDPTLTCNTTTHECVKRCATSGDCAAPTPYCDTASSVCVECLGDANCTGGFLGGRACNMTTHQCVQCTSDQNCTSDPARSHCDVAINRCVACTTSADCASGGTCQNGRCSGCGAGQTDCNGNCVDTQTSAENCGTCGHRCTDRQVCNAGTCGCRTGLTSCTAAGGGLAACVDTNSNPNACGGCPDLATQSHICAMGEECQGGVCLPSSTGCSAPTPDACPVGGGGGRVACVNRATDPLDCGECGNVCNANETCVDGNCQAP